MDPVTLVIAALVAGAGTGATAVASEAITDAYKGLKTLIHRLFAGRQSSEVALEQHAGAPDVWHAPLEAALKDANVGNDAAILAAAKKLLELADPAGSTEGKYTVTVTGSQGVQVGDRGTMTVNVGLPPAPPIV